MKYLHHVINVKNNTIEIKRVEVNIAGNKNNKGNRCPRWRKNVLQVNPHWYAKSSYEAIFYSLSKSSAAESCGLLTSSCSKRIYTFMTLKSVHQCYAQCHWKKISLKVPTMICRKMITKYRRECLKHKNHYKPLEVGYLNR